MQTQDKTYAGSDDATALPIGSFTGQADYMALTTEPFSVGRQTESTAKNERDNGPSS